MHRPIHRFSIDGRIADDKYLFSSRQDYIAILIESMRYDGYVPRIDIETEWTISYDNGQYLFWLSVYGVYVGKRKSQCIEGLIGQKPIYIQKAKSEEPSKAQA